MEARGVHSGAPESGETRYTHPTVPLTAEKEGNASAGLLGLTASWSCPASGCASFGAAH